MVKCENCGSAEFYKDSGFFFCASCQTQSQDVGQEVEFVYPTENVRLKKTRIRSVRSGNADAEAVGWTSWELYNFALIGLTNELIELGASANIKMTVLQLWARYLGKLEVAFMSTKKKLVPKLSRRYKKRDAAIIYGKILSKTKKRKRKRTETNVTETEACLSDEISMRHINRNKKLMMTADYDRHMQLQANSEGDTLSTFSQSAQSTVGSENRSFRIKFNASAKKEAKKVKQLAKGVPKHKRRKYKETHVTTEYRSGPEIITTSKLLAILYLSLRIHNQDIHLGDMLRYGREGHLSYYRLDCLVPPEVELTKQETNFLSRVTDVTHKGMRRIIGRMAKFLGVRHIICPNFLPLINRYCSELALPNGISLYAERLIALSPPKLFDMIFHKRFHIPNYEGRAMAFIIVVMKILLGLDNVTEYEISNVADRINSAINVEGISDVKLFSFREWQMYVECRRTVLINAHCPTKLKHSPNTPDVNSLYLRFLEFIDSKTDRKSEITTRKHLMPSQLVETMKQCISVVSHIDLPLNEVTQFLPSLTPHRSYLQQLLENPLHDLPRILQSDFCSTKIGYMTKPEYICRLAAEHDVQVNFIDSNLHFVEKLVPLFEQKKMPSVKELQEKVVVQDQLEDITCVEGKEDFTEYLHRNVPCEIKIDATKSQYYRERRHAAAAAETDNVFAFAETLPNGKLSIPDRNDTKSDALENEEVSKEELLSKFCKTYNLDLSRAEERVLLTGSNLRRKQKRESVRDVRGKFVKSNDVTQKTPSSDCPIKSETISPDNVDLEDVSDLLPNISDILNASSNASIFNDLINDQSENRCETTNELAFGDLLNLQSDKLNDGVLRLFRPFKDYWMYHCVFSRVKPKNFELFEKMLPKSFRWLLNECANTIEMPIEDFYQELCVVEELLEKFIAQLGSTE
ncbi:TATA box-binding protein-associated factor RNA polymerase I subunit B [Pseudomyrmex gracilis]|uniref:TATA box-binding protein-associated factor RNA polymerase I subunit B n=1 Tax=Pseudomyrmex gracilis TaxID=219809 RepID=UPI0009952F59|nr:TATA box-binding protein-associated factor RNA polymerase I subunit B [Pseudomyrmex gracilis]